jgi:hypothetical protein
MLDLLDKLLYDHCMAVQRELNLTYLIRGNGGIQAVQGRLLQYGLCSFTKWDPGPPQWRFVYDTYLSKNELEQILIDLARRYDVRVEVKKQTGMLKS